METSTDGFTWERDAKYEYYLHGPLARTTIGQQQSLSRLSGMQGTDYAYTLQSLSRLSGSWLKGMNSTGATATHDIGGDGKAGSIHQYVARDALGFNLNYFHGDFKAINAGVNPFPDYVTRLIALSDTLYRPLYNGNISSMATSIRKFGDAGYLHTYKYDQLNRLTRQDVFKNFDRTNNSYANLTPTIMFGERVSYDANGNILTYRRGSGGEFDNLMDSLSYKYYAGTNRLRQVRDSVPDSRYGANAWDIIQDIDNQPDTSNYVYDAIGNIIQDKQEGITSIKWNVYGKIMEINRNASTRNAYTKMVYTYDAQGNRIGKVTNQGTGKQVYTWYVRDAQGNLMSTYTTEATSPVAEANLGTLFLAQADLQIYGSSRLGMIPPPNAVVDNGGNTSGPYINPDYKGTVYPRGWRQYELTNHLGNVLTVVSDRKFGVYSGGSLTLPNDSVIAAVDYYEPDMMSANDYYPFGMLSRVATGPGGPEKQYKYGFNGKENDYEAKGWQNQQDYGMRVYDPRIGRFLSVDPLTQSFPWYTPYQFAGNKPIWAIDLDGAEEKPINNGTEEAQPDETFENHPVAGTDGGYLTLSQKWKWHKGGLTSGLTKTTAGWYTPEEYQELLSKTLIASVVALDLNFFNGGPANFGHDAAEPLGRPELEKFIGNSLNSNATAAILNAAKMLADRRSFRVTGQVDLSSVNAEDFIGLGLLLKGGIRMIAGQLQKAATARTLASWGVVEEIKVAPVLITTSAKGLEPSFVYTIFQSNGELYKFGVSGADGKRLAESLAEAGPGAYFNTTSIMTKQKAHVIEKYLRSLQYNSTGQFVLPGMKKPLPIDFNTGKPIRSAK